MNQTPPKMSTFAQELELSLNQALAYVQGRGPVRVTVSETTVPPIRGVQVSRASLIVDLTDGRRIPVPLDWFPRLLHATPAERKKWTLIGKGAGIHRDVLDEDISAEGLLAGIRSGESEASLKKRLDSRRSRLPGRPGTPAKTAPRGSMKRGLGE